MSYAKLGDKVTLQGNFVQEIFRREGFAIAKFETIRTEQLPEVLVTQKSLRKEFIVRGDGFPEELYQGQVLEIIGEWKRDAKEQIVLYASLIVPTIPSGEEDFKRFLEHAVPGIGKKLSHAIWEYCEGDSSRITSNEMLLSASIKGLSQRKASLIARRIEETGVLSALSKKLNKVSDPLVIRRLVSNYGVSSLKVVTENPYSTWEVIGFDKADQIALALNFAPKGTARIQSAILATMSVLRTRTSSILIDLGKLQSAAQAICNANTDGDFITAEDIGNELKRMRSEHIIESTKYRGKHHLYLREDYTTEYNLAFRLREFSKVRSSAKEVAQYEAAFESWKKKHPDIHFHERQQDAVLNSSNLLSVITGGPGTGKTTVLKAIMETYATIYPESPITLMAPTGLAAKRMTEACGRKAHTIHKTLGLVPANNASGFTYTDERRLTGLIIVDETSMIGLHLADFLIEAVVNTADTKVVFVGDVDQLPSVSPGTFLKDIIDSKKIAVTKLTKNYRQAGGSNIADVAIKVNNQDTKNIRFKEDCLFQSLAEEDILKTLLEEYQKSVREYGLRETYIITPTHKNLDDPLSSNSLNNTLQSILNPLKSGQIEASVGKLKFRKGDRVINKKNDENVINGDIGYITEIITDEMGVYLKINFSGNVVTFSPEKLKQLELAYAITVHSSQGCEFKSVLMPISEKHQLMLTKNLLYTAITRAKARMLLLGNEDEFMASTLNIRSSVKADLLTQRIIAE